MSNSVDVTPHRERLSVTAQISNEMVRLYKEHFGRGPVSVKTSWADPNVLICVLESTLTPVERNMVRMGEHGRLRDTRLFFQYATVDEFCQPVERLTGRTVRAFVSGIDTVVDGPVDRDVRPLPSDVDDQPSRRGLDGGPVRSS
jgi:uncharacterized protein YbcI